MSNFPYLEEDKRKKIIPFLKKAPIITSDVAGAFGLNIKYIDLKLDVSGALKKDENQEWTIYVNGNHASTRRRFTIAHELGHFLLHKDKVKDGIVEDFFWRAENLSGKQETEANQFAADLLMPYELIREHQAQGTTERDELAKKFQVSSFAMRIRLENQQKN